MNSDSQPASDTQTAILEEVRALRVRVDHLTVLLDKKVKPHLSIRAAKRETGRTEAEILNAIHRKALPAVPCVARGGRKSFKIRREDLIAWSVKVSA